MMGEPPGACNMHTSDYMPAKRRILVFRGGDGQEYLNDLHTLDVDTFRCALCEFFQTYSNSVFCFVVARPLS